MATQSIAYYEREYKPVEPQAPRCDGLTILSLPDDTRELYAALETAGRRLAERYNAGGTADTISAWITYLLQEFETRLNDPLKAEKYLKDLRRDIEARLADGRW